MHLLFPGVVFVLFGGAGSEGHVLLAHNFVLAIVACRVAYLVIKVGIEKAK